MTVEYHYAKRNLGQVSDLRPYMGCDPEFFFKADDQVIGAEKILPKDGLVLTSGGQCTSISNSQSKLIIDGVQAELNPRADTCRANLANEIAACFRQLKTEMVKHGTGLTADFSRAVTISKENLMALEESSRKFGCAPSNSIYQENSGLKINEVDPTEYRVRAAGGHIHIGMGGNPSLQRALAQMPEKTVQMLDLICGNTAVLVDRDEANIERRKVYGKAGEYRLPKHGLEYRTLSNFWLTSYPLMSFAFGMARLAVQLMADTEHEAYYDEFMSRVNSDNVKNAINNNDFDLAMHNFKSIEDLIVDVSAKTQNYAVHGDNIIEFHHFVRTVQEKGIKHWFPQDPMTHWTTIGECHAGGFHDFLLGPVRRDLNASKKAA